MKVEMDEKEMFGFVAEVAVLIMVAMTVGAYLRPSTVVTAAPSVTVQPPAVSVEAPKITNQLPAAQVEVRPAITVQAAAPAVTVQPAVPAIYVRADTPYANKLLAQTAVPATVLAQPAPVVQESATEQLWGDPLPPPKVRR